MAQNIAQGGLLDRASALIKNASVDLQGQIFQRISDVFNSTLASIIFALIACFWVYNKIGKEWGKEDFYKAGSWLLMFIILKAIFASKENYFGFIQLVNLIVAWFYHGVSKIFEVTNISDDLFRGAIEIVKNIWGEIDFSTPSMALMLLILGLFLFLIITFYMLYLTIFIIIIGLVCAIILSICPIMLPCLIIPNLRGYFFSWLKLYISTAIQPIFATIIGGMMSSMINTQVNELSTQAYKGAWGEESNLAYATTGLFVIIILSIVAILLISKIPTWAQQIVGSGDGEHKTGLAGAMSLAKGMTSRTYQGYSTARNDMNYATGGRNSFGRALASGIVGAIPGLSGLAQRIAGQTGQQRQAYSDRMLKESMQSGSFTSMPTPHTDNNKNKG